MNDMRALFHRPIRAIEISLDKERITFHFTDGDIYFETEGDCCSRSWIEHITIPPDIAGAEITATTELPTTDHADGWAHIQVYQTAFATNKGEIILEYRNASNGYYGGWLNGPLS